jgi:hypothetical protein
MARKLKEWREMTRKSGDVRCVETEMFLNLKRWSSFLVAGALACLGTFVHGGRREGGCRGSL